MRQPLAGDRLDIISPAHWVRYSGVISKVGLNYLGETIVFLLGDDGETHECWVGELTV